MKKSQKKAALFLSVALLLAMMLPACSPKDGDASSKSPDESTSQVGSEKPDTATDIRIQDDLYQAVNAEWLKNSVIPDDQPSDNPMSALDKAVTQTLIGDFQKMMDEEKDVEGPLGEFLKLYKMQLDYAAREELGVKPILPLIEKIEKISDMDAFNAALYDLTLSGYTLPYVLHVAPDIKNSAVNVLTATSPALFLGSKDYYTEEMYPQLSPIYAGVMEQMFAATGKTEAEAKTLTEQAMAFDALLAESSLTMEEQSNYATLYSEVSFDTFVSYSDAIDFESLVVQLIGEKPSKVTMTNQNHFEVLGQIITEENFDNMKSWMTYNIINAYSSYLTEEMDTLSHQYGMALFGVTEMTAREERSYNAVRSLFAPVVGQYYGETYFGEDAKKDATEITKNLIQTYREKLEQNDWLSESTKEKAILKLDTMQIYIGYPDETGIDPLFYEVSFDPNKTIIENLDAYTRQAQQDLFSKYGKPHNKDIWTATGDTVNAFYSPINNSISFTAAIMQDPFYDPQATLSEKYGSFGSVVGHEISHAFDPNGAQFDENGNLHNWWTEEDYAKFEEKTAAVFAQFDGVAFAEGQVNATLTNSENVADNAGIKASFDALHKLEEANAEEFFLAWASVWRINSTPEYDAQLLIMDTHAPHPLRVNIPVSNFDEFYELFDVTEEDGMFRPKEERVFVW